MHLAYTFIVMLAVALAGCKSEAPKQQAPAKPANTAPQNNNGNNNNQNNNQNSNDSNKGDSSKKSKRSDDGDEDKKKKPKDDEDCDDSSSSARKISYEGDIKKIIADNCISCHKTKAPILTTYAKVKAEADDVYDSVKSKRMPEDEALAKADIDLIKKWIDDGKLEKASSSSSSSDKCEEDDGNKKSSTGTKKSPEEQLKELLETKAFKECKADDRVYDRSGKKCLEAKIATSYKCTKEGVIGAFEKIDIDVSSNMTTILGEGYEIEQCGELEDDPVVTFLKKDLKAVTAKFRRICASGSAACQ
jgi:hypothetical protein